MPISTTSLRNYLVEFELQQLFIEVLGWDNYRSKIQSFAHDGITYTFQPVAQKAGMLILACHASDGNIPPKGARDRIERHISNIGSEHILIFLDGAKTTSMWQWVNREDGKAKTRTHTYHKGDRGDALLQKLAGIAFSIEELDDEGRISIADVTRKVSENFDVEKVTRKFYDRFKTEHSAFLKFLSGLPSGAPSDWYASVMLNRLMFLYFIQKKGFLDGDTDYLQTKLAQVSGAGQNFYRDFLLSLFFHGLACEERERDAETNALLGAIPYLNGGLFLPHPLEDQYGNEIEISNQAFKQLFAFFDAYTWHLDDRPLRQGNEINPDVLGYIFEKYINQKQMGAYYTKEDITGYICRSTILPFLLDKCGLEVKDLIPGRGDGEAIDPYIFEAVATENYLPTETEREYIARRRRYRQIKEDYAAGKIATVDDLVTYNLDIQGVTEDWLRGLSDPVVLRRFYGDCLTKLTVLDPTAGSGAFLFAAINILEPLYDLALDKMRQFAAKEPVKYLDFKDELERVEKHPNRRYYILKRIIVDNLYGVDIMDEAVEICKLRLFLKIVAQVDDVQHIEPLPDIDFNIRAGNTLVGFATRGETEGKLFATDMLKRKIEDADRALRNFRQLQTRLGIEAELLKSAKIAIQEQMATIREELDEVLRVEYGLPTLDAFRTSHKPFHWYVEFNNVLADDGFDVIVGNPPYVSVNKVDYLNTKQREQRFSDIYAHVLMKTFEVGKSSGRIGMIVPLSLTFSGDFSALRKRFAVNGVSWVSSFDNIPAAVFEGVSQRCSIWIHQTNGTSQLFTTPMYRWRSEYRPALMSRLTYTPISSSKIAEKGIPKLEGEACVRLLDAISNTHLREALFPKKSTIQLGFSQTARNFVSAFIEPPPHLDANTLANTESSKQSFLNIKDDKTRKVLLSLLLGEVYFWYWLTRGDGFDVTTWIVTDYGAVVNQLDENLRLYLEQLGNILHQRRFEALQFKKNAGKYVGNYNYRKLYQYTRRADLLLLMALEFDASSVQAVFDYVQRVRSINVFAGEKKIPASVKQKYPLLEVDASLEQSIIDEIDRVLARHYGFTDEQLNFIINYDIKYRMGKDAEEGDQDDDDA